MRLYIDTANSAAEGCEGHSEDLSLSGLRGLQEGIRHVIMCF